MLLTHGGNIRKISDYYRLAQNKFIDFSNNVNPLGINTKIKDTIIKKIHLLAQYPDPECKVAKGTLANYLGIPKNNILLGNGSNEIIHIIPRALNCSSALIYHPTFSEYELGLRLSNVKIYSLFAQESKNFCIDIKKIISHLPKVKLITLCNPNNPTGFLLEKKQLLKLMKACEKNKTYLLVDEAFIEFVEKYNNYSLVKETMQYKYLLVLRSMTKFFSVPGLRIGYLVANKATIHKINLFQPTWSVNTFAQEVMTKDILNSNFIKKTKDYIKKERMLLFNNLKEIPTVYPYYPTANFIFCKILNKKLNACSLFKRLLKHNIIIRDCSNFKGLNNRFFRIAVKKRKENVYLIKCLRRIFQ